MQLGAILLIFLMASASLRPGLAQTTSNSNPPEAAALRMGIGLHENS